MTQAIDPEALRRFDDLWDFQDPAGTEARFRQLLPSLEGSSEPSLALQLRTQIARAQGMQKRYDEAHDTLDGVEAMLGGAPAVVRVRYLLERGRVLNTSGRPEEAKALFHESWRVAQEAEEDGFAVDAAHMIAIVEEPDAAIEWNEKGLELARSSRDERASKWRGSLLNNLGWTYHDLGRHETALARFEEALEVRRAQGDAVTIQIGRWCVARTHRSLGRLDEALAEQHALLEEHEASGSTDGYVLEEIAECLHALGRPEEARPWFARAHEELAKDPWLPEGEPERLARLARLGAGEPEAPTGSVE